MIVFVDGQVHISLGKVFLVLEEETYIAATHRGKALRRAQALRARQAQAQEAADRKRDRMTGLLP
jgi:hypothetical protein